MGFTQKTETGRTKACWRDPTGKQKSKTFATKREATAFLAEVAATVNRGTYVAPDAGRLLFRVYTDRWLESRNFGERANERTLSILRTHVLPQWGAWPINRIDHIAVQVWVTTLGKTLAPATVAKCFGVVRAVLRSAMRSRLIAVDPTDGVTAPSTYQARPATDIISRSDFLRRLLPAVPRAHRAMVALAGGTGMRWGECAGLSWDHLDLDRCAVQVERVAVETAGTVTIRHSPKTRAGARSVPLPDFVVYELQEHRALTLGEEPAEPGRLVFATWNGTAFRRSNFRRQVWRLALVRAGLLGEVEPLGPDRWRATWLDHGGRRHLEELATEHEAVAQVAEHAAGGLRFHDLRHSYATWLVSEGLPVNVVQRVMGHEQASTTLNRYTHAPEDYEGRVRAALTVPAASALPAGHEDRPAVGREREEHRP